MSSFRLVPTWPTRHTRSHKIHPSSQPQHMTPRSFHAPWAIWMLCTLLVMSSVLIGAGFPAPVLAATPPFANAGPDQSVEVGDQVLLDGSGSTDINGQALTYQWTIVKEPAGSAAELDEAIAVQPRFYANVVGTYIVQLVVTDSEGLSSSADQVTVHVEENTPPVAHITAPAQGALEETISLDGSGSTDIDGDALTYQWTVTVKPEGSQAEFAESTAVQPALTIDESGDYHGTLQVHDGEAQSDVATFAFTTDADSNLLPVAVPTVTAPMGKALEANDTVTLSGTASYDPDDAQATVTYAWSLLTRPGDSTAELSGATTATPSFEADVLGDYVVQLMVTDRDGAASAPVTVLVSPNRRPVADAGSSRTVTVGQEVLLDGTGSSDPDGSFLTYQWAILSQPAGPGEEGHVVLDAPHGAQSRWTPVVAGTYVVQLIVQDGTFPSQPATVTLTALQASETEPSLSIDPLALVEENQPEPSPMTQTNNGGQRLTDDLLVEYHFNEGKNDSTATVVEDQSPSKSQSGLGLDLTIENLNNVTWHTNDASLTLLEGAQLSSQDTDLEEDLNEALRTSGEGTIEAWITPASDSTDGEARIVTLSDNNDAVNAALHQRGGQYRARLRTNDLTVSNREKGFPSLRTNRSQASARETHVVFTWEQLVPDGFTRVIYVDGQPVKNDTLNGALGNWNLAYPLTLGHEATGTNTAHSWQGTLHLVAIYKKALSGTQVMDNYTAGPDDDGLEEETAMGATITVDENASPACTLVDAITAANKDEATGGCTAGSPDGVDTIEFAESGVIELGLRDGTYSAPFPGRTDGIGLPLIETPMIIDGGLNGVTIERDATSTVCTAVTIEQMATDTSIFRILAVSPEGDLTLRNVTVRNGCASQGGGIYNEGTLTLVDSVVSENTAWGGEVAWSQGGGIFSGARESAQETSVTLERSKVLDNTVVIHSSGIAQGGGIYIDANEDGASATLKLVQSTVSGNAALAQNNAQGSAEGGGIFIGAGGTSTVTLEESEVSLNCAIAQGISRGGGIYSEAILGSSSATVRLEQSTVAANSARASNESLTEGGGIYSNGAGTGTATVELSGSLVIGNSILDLADNPTEDNLTADFILDPPLNLPDLPNITSGNSTGVLGSLAQNGGPTRTHNLFANSDEFTNPAIRVESPEDVGRDCNFATDQRGEPRDARCDIGAVEWVEDTDPFRPTPKLRVTVTGSGSVESSANHNGDQIDCPTGCDADFYEYTVVVLTAKPDAGSIFTGWTGATCETVEPKHHTMVSVPMEDKDRDCTATFVPGYTLTLGVTQGEGTIQADDPYGHFVCSALSCKFGVPRSQLPQVILRPQGTNGHDFVQWNGDGTCTGSTPVCRVEMTVDRAVEAEFVDTEDPTVTITSPAGGEVSGTAVPLTATASDNVGVVGVQFVVGGVNYGTEVTTSPYTIVWDTTGLDGSYPVTAIARDAAGNTTTSAGVDVTVAPANGASGEQRVTDDLLVEYRFEDGSGTTVADQSPSKSQSGLGLDLTIQDPSKVSWNSDPSLTLSVGARLFSQNTTLAEDLNQALIDSDEGTIEAWITPTSDSTAGEARIVTLSENGSNVQAALHQKDGQFRVRLRTNESTGSDQQRGLPSLKTNGSQASARQMHVVFTWGWNSDVSAYKRVIYVDGQSVKSDSYNGPLANWDLNYPLTLGHEGTGTNSSHSWQGTLHLVAIYKKALSVDEILQNKEAGTTHDLTVTLAGSGLGSVTSTVADVEIDCQSSPCSLAVGASVELTATAEVGSVFTEWTGATCVTEATKFENPLTVTMDEDTACTANFVPGYTLTLGVPVGEGTIQADPPYAHFVCSALSCDFGVPSNESVTLTATGTNGHDFDAWDCSAGTVDTTVSPSTCTVVMSVDRTVEAEFVAPAPLLVAEIRVEGEVHDDEVQVGETVRLDGSGSHDPNDPNASLTYLWEMTGAPAGNTFTFDVLPTRDWTRFDEGMPLNLPTALAVWKESHPTLEGDIYMANGGADELLRCTADGSAWEQIAGGLLEASGVAVGVDPDTRSPRLYVSHKGHENVNTDDGIEVFEFANDEWTATNTWTQATNSLDFVTPLGLAVGRVEPYVGYLFVADKGLKKVVILEPDGTPSTTLGVPNENMPEDFHPTELAFGPTGTLYVVDARSQRLVIYEPDANTNGELKHDNEITYGFDSNSSLYGVVVDDLGYVYVTDTDNYRIQVFAADGRFMGTLGGENTDQGQVFTEGLFYGPTGIEVNPAGGLLVTDLGSSLDWIQELTWTDYWLERKESFPFEPDAAGQYTFNLKVSNGTGSAEDDRVLTAVADLQPIAQVVIDGQVVSESGTTVPIEAGVDTVIDGSVSYDPHKEGETNQGISLYTWTFVNNWHTPSPLSGADASSITAPSSLSNGTQTFTLVVQDGAGSTSEALQVTLELSSRPTAVLGGVPSVVSTEEVVSLDGTGSEDDEDLTTLTYHWAAERAADGLVENWVTDSATTTWTPTEAGIYTIELRVADTTGLQSQPKTASVTVRANQRPTAHAGKDRTAKVGQRITLTGERSSDQEDGTTLTYAWRLVNGPDPDATLDLLPTEAQAITDHGYKLSEVSWETPSRLTFGPDGELYVTSWVVLQDLPFVRVLSPGLDPVAITDETNVDWGQPSGVAVGVYANTGSLRLYVADEHRNQIEVFEYDDSNNTWGYADTWTEANSLSFGEPSGVAIGPEGHVYVADTLNDRVVVLDQDGGYVGELEGYTFEKPAGVAVSPDGAIYVTDMGTNRSDDERVVVYDPGDCDPLQDADCPWYKEHDFDVPQGLALDSKGNFYVADKSHSRVQSFTAAGFYRGSVEPADAFDNPMGVAIDDEDRLYVADSYNDRVQVFNFVDNTAVPTPSFRADVAGEYTVELVVYDQEGLASEVDTVRITVEETVVPVAVIEVDGTEVSANELVSVPINSTVTLKGGAPNVPENDTATLTYYWTLDAPGSSASLSVDDEVITELTPNTYEEYTVTLQVTDTDTGEVSEEVQVRLTTENVLTVDVDEVVDTDNGTACALDEAIEFANAQTKNASHDCAPTSLAQSGKTWIVFDETVGDVTLKKALPSVASEMVIEADGRTIQRHLIDGDATAICDSLSSGANFRILTVTTTGDLMLNQATIRYGCVDGTVGDSSRGGGILTEGELTLNHSTVIRNEARHEGGGVYVKGGTVAVTASTVAGNKAIDAGGGLYVNGGTVEVRNSTVSGNQATALGGGDGGGIYHEAGTIDILFSTITENTVSGEAGGLKITTDADVCSSGNLIVGNTAGQDPDLMGNPTGTCLIGDYGTRTGSSAMVLDPTLQNNGGPTATHALFGDSPALEAAGADCSSHFSDDQRGLPRPYDADDDDDNYCDLGAVEWRPMPVANLNLPTGPVEVNEPVLLDGSGSTNPSGETPTYIWTVTRTSDQAVVYDREGASATRTWLPHAPGMYEVQLVVRDGLLISLPDRETLEVVENHTPTAVLSVNGTEQADGATVVVLTGTTVTLDASGSTDGSTVPPVLTYEWGMALGASEWIPASSDDAAFEWEVPAGVNDYTLTLTVRDAQGVASNPVTVTLQVHDWLTVNGMGSGQNEGDDVCTLAEAIALANSGLIEHDDCGLGADGLDGIRFAKGLTTVRLTQALPLVDSPIVIEGAGRIIERDKGSADDPCGDDLQEKFRIFKVTGNGDLTLDRVTLRYGCASGDDFEEDAGGGISTAGKLSLVNSTVIDNEAAQCGGGLYVDGGTVMLTSSTVAMNKSGREGGGLFLGRGETIIRQSTISGNQAANSTGGGVFNSVSLELIQSTVTNNIARNSGGGLENDLSLTAIKISGSIIAGNQISGANARDVEIHGPFASVGLPNLIGSSELTTAQAIELENEGDAMNEAIPDGALRDMVDILATSDSTTGDANTPLERILFTELDMNNTPIPVLADNGGLTPTHNLVQGSPAIDAAGENCGVTEDQRGVARPMDGDGDTPAACDIGAVEWVDMTPPQITPGSVTVLSTTEVTLTWTTDEKATSQVVFGTQSNTYDQASTVDTTPKRNHSVTLTGLTANTQYFYRLVSVDEAGNEGLSHEATFTTDSGGETLPSISPSNSATIYGSSVAFTWNPGTANVTHWRFRLCCDQSQNFYFDSRSLPGTTLGVIADGLPADGSTVIGTLWYKVEGRTSWNRDIEVTYTSDPTP